LFFSESPYLQCDIPAIVLVLVILQHQLNHKIALHDKGDFLVDDRWVIEVGGKSKSEKQIRGENEAFLAVDDIKTGFGKKIPLYLFGLLY
jgi:uncharacterized protein